MNVMYEPPAMSEMPKPEEKKPVCIIRLVRDKEIEPRNGLPGETFGKIFVDERDDHVCETHEGQDRRLEEGNDHKQSAGTAIPTGLWRVTLHNCRQNGVAPMLNAVPGFQGVQISKERANHRMPGAITIGEHRNIAGVSMSQLPMNHLVGYIRHKTMQDIKVYLEVSRAV